MTCALPSCYVSETLRENGYRHALRTPLVKAIELYELPKDIPIATLCAGSACALILRGYTSFGYVNGFRVRVRRSGIDEKAVKVEELRIPDCGCVCSACVSARLRNSESCIFLGSARASRNELTLGTAHATMCSTTPKTALREDYHGSVRHHRSAGR
jgi:hypothetical protein